MKTKLRKIEKLAIDGGALGFPLTFDTGAVRVCVPDGQTLTLPSLAATGEKVEGKTPPSLGFLICRGTGEAPRSR